MPTIIYLVHGMGCGTADGNPRAPEASWSVGAVAAMRWIATTFGLPEPMVLDPVPADPPPGSDDPAALWLVPISYHGVFDEFRRASQDRRKHARTLGDGILTDGEITRLTKSDFAWANCVDVLLWWADTIQTRNWATVKILNAITGADSLASRAGPGGSVRRILISHSLGTAATTYALGELAKQDAWRNRGAFDAWFTLANVAPFLLTPRLVYDQAFVPGASRSLIAGAMLNARNEFDPVPWLLPWRAFSVADAGPPNNPWQRAQEDGLFSVVATRGVSAPPGLVPAISDVHGFANYLMAPRVAALLAGHARGEAFSDAELAAIGNTPWETLPALSCRNPGAMDLLRAAVEAYTTAGPGDVSNNKDRALVDRLLRGVELLAAARDQC
jgi:hypothetical protein